MKRTYITPSAETVDVATEQMIAFSFDRGNASGSSSLNDEYADEVLSKDIDFSLW